MFRKESSQLMSGKKYRVEYASCPSYEDKKQLRNAIEKVLAPQIADFGGSVSGKSLVLKPNWLAWRPGRKIDIACVHPSFTVETAKILIDAGAKKVSIMENPAVQTAPAIARSMGIDEELNKLGVDIFNFTDYAKTTPVEGMKFHNIEVAREHLPFDAMVNIAKAKTHAMMVLTLAVKNLFGMVKGSERMGWHLAVGKDFPKFADMLLDIYLAVRPQFNLLDAITCMEGNGPGSGTPTERRFVAGCSDALALDASVTPILGVDNLFILRNAEVRGLLPEFENSGEIPQRNPLVLPPPPGMFVEWGMPLPPFLKGIMRDIVISKPILDKKLCVGCGLCAKMCPPQSLKMKDGFPVFDLKNCIRCYCCQEHCPKGAITSYKTFPMKVSEKVEDIVRSFFGFGRGCRGK